jgi:hypothetical protein
MNTSAAFEDTVSRIEHFLLLLEKRVQKPFAIIDEDQLRGFRFGAPGPVHFVILNVANSVASIRAAALLVENGFQSQAFMLMRTILEAQSKLSYVLSGFRGGSIDKKTTDFLDSYFSDNRRNVEGRPPYRPVAQKEIHKRNSQKIADDVRLAKSLGLKQKMNAGEEAFEQLQSDLYMNFNNHLHGRYPEAMDIYGEMTFSLNLSGNFESKDIDEYIERSFLLEVAKGTETRFKLALINMAGVKLIQLSEEEKSFCFEGLF